MDAVEFAKKWGGKLFKIPVESMPPGLAENTSAQPRGMLIGYVNGDADRVVLELDEYSGRYGWPLHSGITLTIDRENMYNPHDIMVLTVNYKRLHAPKSLSDFKTDFKNLTDAAKPQKRSNPYPQTCLTCKAPARKYDEQVICSNSNCKTRSSFLKSIKYRPVKNEMRPIHCRQLGCKGIGLYPIKNDIGSDWSAGFFIEFDCGHEFKFLASEFLLNNILYCTRLGYTNDRIWNGSSWVNI